MSNGIGKNPLNDISEVYLEMRESYKIEPPKERLKTDRNMFNIPKDEQEAARERLKAKTAAKRAERAKMKEALDPVGKEDDDVNNDGKKDSTDSYLLKRRKAIAKAMKTRKEELETTEIEITEEMVASNAAHYFYEEGINEEGVEIFIEELGLEEFVSFVEDLSADLLTEARAARRARKGAKSYDQVKAEIDAKEAAKKKASPAKVQSATATAKKQQPKKRGALDSIARTVLKGMDRHKAAMARAKSDIQTTKKIASKVGKGAREFGKGFASGVKTAGKTAKVAKKAMEEYSDWRSDLVEADLIEVMDEDEAEKPIKEKKVNNKVKINPKLGEAIDEIGGTLIEAVEDDEFDAIIESVYDELIEEGYSEEDVEDAIEFALTEPLNEVSDSYYDSAVKSSKKAAAKIKRDEMMKRAKGRLRFMKRKAGETVNKLKGKAAGAAVAATMAGGIAKDQARRTGRAVKQAVTSAPEKAKRSIKDRIKKAALGVAKRMSEETQDLQELPIVPMAAGAAALGGAAMAINKAMKAAKTHSDKSVGKPTIQGAASGLRNKNAKLQKALDLLKQSHEPEGDVIDEKFGMAADPSKPESPKPTKLPKSRERNIGKHNDYKDNPNRDFGERPEKGKKLQSRLSAVVGTQRRQDKETGVREEHELDEAKKKMPYVKMFRKAGNLGRDGSPEAMERSKKITGVMNKNAERVAAHRAKDDAAKDKKAKMKEELSVDQQMKISREYNRMSPEEKRKANKKAMGNVVKVAPKKDTRTDAQKMTDATGPRPGSRYRGD